jgi:integrase/recombinase XerD
MFAVVGERAASGEPLALRNLALLELLYGSGLRATELVSLPRRAVRPGQPFLMLRGKGDKERLVPVSSRAAEAVRNGCRMSPKAVPGSFRRKVHLSRVRLFHWFGHGGIGGHCAAPDQPACPPPRLCDPPAGWRRRPACPQSLLAGRHRHHAIYTHVDAARLVELVNARHPLATGHGKGVGVDG